MILIMHLMEENNRLIRGGGEFQLQHTQIAIQYRKGSALQCIFIERVKFSAIENGYVHVTTHSGVSSRMIFYLSWDQMKVSVKLFQNRE